MNLDYKLFVLPGITIVLIIAFIFLGIFPKQKQIDGLKQELNNLEGNEESKITKQMVDNKQADVDSLTLMLAEIEKRNYKSGDLSSLGIDFDALGKKHGLRILYVQPDYASLSQLSDKATDVFELPFAVQFEGAFSQWTRFMDDVPTFPFAMRVESIVLQKDETTSKLLKCMIGGYIVFLRNQPEDKAKNI